MLFGAHPDATSACTGFSGGVRASHRGRQIARLGDHELLNEEGEVQVLGVEAVQASRRPTAARMNRDALGRRCEAKRRSPEVAALGKRGGRADVAGRWTRQGRTAAAAMKDGGRGRMRGGTLDPAEAWRRTCSGGRQEAGRRTG